MSVRTLHLLGSPVLRQESAPVAAVDDAVRRFVDDLFETMHAAKGVGLAANQVGVAQRVAVVEADGEALALINPVIVAREGTVTGEEGCLSIPDIYADVTRAAQVTIEALDRDGRPYRRAATGLLARAIQHELDHLDGVLFLDHVGPLKRQLLLARYRKDRRGESGYLKEIDPATAQPE